MWTRLMCGRRICGRKRRRGAGAEIAGDASTAPVSSAAGESAAIMLFTSGGAVDGSEPGTPGGWPATYWLDVSAWSGAATMLATSAWGGRVSGVEGRCRLGIFRRGLERLTSRRRGENGTFLVLPRIVRSTQKFNQIRSNEVGRRARSLSRGTASHQRLF